MSRPFLLLDVDGVLNVPVQSADERDRRIVRLQMKPGSMISFYPTAITKPFMEMVWARFEIRWLTAWGDGANAIARWAGLPERPALDASFHSEEWKTDLAARASEHWSSRVAWIEDGISEVAKLLIQAKGWTYLHCDPYVGVTKEHFQLLEVF